MLETIHESWQKLVIPLLYQEPLNSLREILLDTPYSPSPENIFRAFSMPLDKVRVVILGQGPNPTRSLDTGLAYAMPTGSSLSPTLRVISNEIDKESVGKGFKNWETLEHWENQGVFLLNTSLTTNAGMTNTHQIEWENFTINIVRYLSNNHPCVWLLWGKQLQQYSKYINNRFDVVNYTKNSIKLIPKNPDYNYVLTAPHPLSEVYSYGNGGFYGCNHFLFTNHILHTTAIKW